MTVASISSSEPRTRRWRREEFYQLASDGWFRGQRVLLLEGEIIQMPPMKHAHVVAVSKVANALRNLYPSEYWVREEKPLNATDDSEPEPDVAVASGAMDSYDDHPTGAVLVVEVSDTTLHLDRRKAALYAEIGIGEYWILNLQNRKLEVYRSPDRGSREYRDHRVLNEADSVSPQSKPDALIRIKDLLP